MKARLAQVFERAAKSYGCFNRAAHHHQRTIKKDADLKFCERGPREAEQIVEQEGAKDQKRYNDDDGCDRMDRREPC